MIKKVKDKAFHYWHNHKIESIVFCHVLLFILKLRKPGPAISIKEKSLISLSNISFNFSAITLGFLFTFLANIIAAFEDKSKLNLSGGVSTTIF